MDEHPLSKRLAELKSREFWRELAPALTIRDDCRFDAAAAWVPPFNADDAFQARLDHEGYVHLPRIMEPDLAKGLAAAVASLAAHGIPPVFCMVYDAFWLPAFRLGRILRSAFGADHVMLPAVWVWHLDPARSESGWRPHRDGGPNALYADRRPKSLSAWFALTEATPLNGCMYVVPADRDPAYGNPDNKTPFELADVRALPAGPGDVLLWTHALLHWGGHASPNAPSPRMSMSIEFARGDEPGTLQPVEPQDIQRFEQRLHLVARQIVRYQHMSGIAPEMAALAWSL